ncbi:MAG: suppressor of fused domain protein [Bryobacteraceae bacterium]
MLASIVREHDLQTTVRLASYADLFGGEPLLTFPYSDFGSPDDDIRVEVLVYPLLDCVALVTNGFSAGGRPRRELIQYCKHGRRADAHRLHAAAYDCVEVGRWLDFGSAISLPYPSGSAWPHTVFLPPPVQAHSDFEITVDGDPMKFLWHVPLSSSEFDYQYDHGIPALLRGMSSVGLPWVFDEATRPVLR